MCAQAVVAIDGPNIKVSIQRLYGPSAYLDYRRFREALYQDASRRLKTDSFDYATTVFLQQPTESQLTDPTRQSRLPAFENMLGQFGWCTVKKSMVESPAELVAVYGALDDALTTHGYRVVGRINRSLRELAIARQDGCKCARTDAKGDLRDASHDLVRFYGEHYGWLTRQVLRALLPILVACSGFSWARYGLKRSLVSAWLSISIAERGQVEFLQHVRETVAMALRSSLVWPDELAAADLADLSDESTLTLAYKLRAILRTERDALHRAGDVDDILSEWVRQQVKPDLTQAAVLPAVVYLVGNDYRNHLVLAERMQRYGAQVVLVMFRCHLARASETTIAQVQGYQSIWLEDFVEGGCANGVAA